MGIVVDSQATTEELKVTAIDSDIVTVEEELRATEELMVTVVDLEAKTH